MRIAAAHTDQRVMVVSHGGVIGHLLHRVTASRRFAFSGPEVPEVAVSPASAGRLDLKARVEALTHPRGLARVDEFPVRPGILSALALGTSVAGWIASPQVHAFAETLGRLLGS